jgi:hypothetical protein
MPWWQGELPSSLGRCRAGSDPVDSIRVVHSSPLLVVGIVLADNSPYLDLAGSNRPEDSLLAVAGSLLAAAHSLDVDCRDRLVPVMDSHLGTKVEVSALGRCRPAVHRIWSPLCLRRLSMNRLSWGSWWWSVAPLRRFVLWWRS